MGRLATFALLHSVLLAGCLSPRPEATDPGTGTGSASGTAVGGSSSGGVGPSGPGSGGSGGSIGSDAGPNESLDAGASGGATGPTILCSPLQLDFGQNAVVGGAGIQATSSVLCTNVGGPGTNLLIPDPTSTQRGLTIQNGDLAFQATFTQPFPAAGLAVGQSTIINVTYSPNAAGMDSDTLIVSSNDPVNPRTAIALTGSAIVLPPCELSVSPQSVALGDVPVGAVESFILTIANVGAGECLVGPFSLSNFTEADGGAFGLPDYPPGGKNDAIIAPGQTLELNIRVTLDQPGPWEGEVDLGSSVNPRSVPVSAYGVQ